MTDANQEKRHQYTGDLRQTALPEMLYSIFMHRVAGLVEASAAGVVKKIWVRDGAVVHASSTDLDDSLGNWLRRSGKISEVDYSNTMRLRESSEKRYGEVLIEQHMLAPVDLYEAIQEQMRAIVWSLFGWHEGEVAFSIGDFEEAEMIRIHLPMRQVILQGVKRAPDAKALVARLGRKDTIFEPTWTTEALIEVALDAAELTLLQLVDGKRSLYEMCTTGPFSPAENARLLYAFHVLRLMRRAGSAQGSGVVKIRFQR